MFGELSPVNYCAMDVVCVSIDLFSLLMYFSVVFNINCPDKLSEQMNK